MWFVLGVLGVLRVLHDHLAELDDLLIATRAQFKLLLLATGSGVEKRSGMLGTLWDPPLEEFYG